MDEAKRIAQSLVKSVQKMREEKIKQPTWHATVPAKLEEIFKEKTEQILKSISCPLSDGRIKENSTIPRQISAEDERGKNKTTKWHATVPAKLADIFKEKTKQIRKVKSTIIQMSATPTSPAAIHNTPRVHQQKTRSKTPSIVPPNSGGGLTTQVSAEKATVRAPDCYETSRNKSSRTRVRTMASSKRNITTISKPVHVPVNQKIIDLKTPLSEIRKITQPNRY